MNEWKCTHCGFTVKENTPPNECPNCHQKCEFVDVTCYIPECGGAGTSNVDPRLGKKLPV